MQKQLYIRFPKDNYGQYSMRLIIFNSFRLVALNNQLCNNTIRNDDSGYIIVILLGIFLFKDCFLGGREYG